MTESNFNAVRTVLNQKMIADQSSIVGLREQSTHSEINPSDIELIKGLVSDA